MGRFDFVPGLLVCSLLVFAPTPGFTQFAKEASVTGTVFAEGSAQRIGNASVALCDDAGNRLLEATASDAGEFSFSGIRGGNYILRVRAEGFADTEVPLDLTMRSQRGISVTLKVASSTRPAVPARPSISAHELSVPEKARELLDSGKKKLYDEKNAAGALKDFQAAIHKCPDYYEAYYQAGVAFLGLQNEGEAERQFRKSAEISQGKYGDADIGIATLLLQRHQDAEGEKLLQQGLALNPQSWKGYVELGKLELSRGHVQPALAAGEKAKSLAPQQPMVHRLLAVAHLQDKNYTALVADLDNYIRLDPDSPAGARAKELRTQVEKQLPQLPNAASK
jgi:Flp pilus assembly protein TadD